MLLDLSSAEEGYKSHSIQIEKESYRKYEGKKERRTEVEESIRYMQSHFIERTGKGSNEKLKPVRSLHLLMLANYHLAV